MARQIDFFILYVLWDKPEHLEEAHAYKKGWTDGTTDGLFSCTCTVGQSRVPGRNPRRQEGQMDGLARQTFFFYMYCGQTKPEQTANSWMMEGQRKDGRLDRWKDGWLN